MKFCFMMYDLDEDGSINIMDAFNSLTTFKSPLHLKDTDVILWGINEKIN